LDAQTSDIDTSQQAESKPKFTSIVVPGSAETNAHGINSKGDIVGGYSLPGEECNPDPNWCPHAFLLRKGKFSTFDIPGATFTFFTRNNSRGDIVGWYGTPDGKTRWGRVHGFLLSGGIGGELSSIDYPGATLTLATGINHQGDIVGRYDTPDNVRH